MVFVNMDGTNDDDLDEHVPADKTFRVAFIHPDLGIGGAERLVVDAALGLQDLGHDVEIITSHHDPNHCFEPTRDGSLKVHHAKTSLPRHLIGALHLPMAIARQLSLFFQLMVALIAFRFPGSVPGFLYRRLTSLPPIQEYDLYIVDQLSTCVPLLRIFTATRVLFYCHFPDKDVGTSIARQKAIERGHSGPGIIRALYRIPFDFLEEMTMSTSDKLLVNSEFTSQQFQKTFYRLARVPRVIYPGINLGESSHEHVDRALHKLEEAEKKEGSSELGVPSVKQAIRSMIKTNDRPTLVSINRFEAKKNIALAVDTFVQVQKEFAAQGHAIKLRLVLGGGYDYRLRDNILTLKELQAQCEKHGLPHLTLFYNRASPHEPPASAPPAREMTNASVIFLPSIPYALLTNLLMHPSSRALLYTPTEEHFGIVPLEAMAVGLPVLATNSGGPMESVVDLHVRKERQTSDQGLSYANPSGTGLLRRATPKLWAQATMDLLQLTGEQRTQLGRNARARVQEKFSRQSMSRQFERCLWEVHAMGAVRPDEGLTQWTIAVAMFVIMMTAYIFFARYANAKQHEGIRTVRSAQLKLRQMQHELEAKQKAFDVSAAASASGTA